MISLWLAMAGLSLVVVGFVLWPLRRHYKTPAGEAELSAGEVSARLQANIALFHEHLAELDFALAEGRITVDQYEQLKLEQERALLDDEEDIRAAGQGFTLGLGARGLILFAAGIILVSLSIYFIRGSSSDLYIQQLQTEKARLDYQDLLQNRNPDPARAQALIKEIEARLEKQPENTQYWFVLARHAIEASDYAKAVNAYQKILALSPGEATVMAELAQAMFLRDNARMSPAIAELAHSALKLTPDNTIALGLAGIEAFQQQDFAATVKYWQKAVDIMGPGSPESRPLLGGIARAKQELEAKGQTKSASPEPDKNSAVASGRKIYLQISLAKSVKASPDQLVYVYARAWQGPKMPLAITRIKVADLPATIILDETMAMSTMSSLAQADKVEVVARISSDGSAIAKPGDFQASFGPLDMEALPEETELVIEQKLSE